VFDDDDEVVKCTLQGCCNLSFIIDKHMQHTVLSLTRRSSKQDYRALCLLRTTNGSHLTSDSPVQSLFDHIFSFISAVYNDDYPRRTVTITSRDLLSITPHIKFLLRQRNVMHSGHIECANALSIKIGTAITKFNAGRLAYIGFTGEEGGVGSDTSRMWKLVNDITGASSYHFQPTPTGLTADSIIAHYASVSTDSSYSAPLPRSSGSPAAYHGPIAWAVHTALTHSKTNATWAEKKPPDSPD